MALILTGASVLGAAIGSFLNVVAHRVPQGVSVVAPRSACPQCGHAIRSWDNIPVLSWMILGGRCRDCRARISVRYPVVELVTAVLFAVFAWYWAPQITAAEDLRTTMAAVLMLLAHLILAGLGMALTLIDLQTHTLPNRLVAALFLSGLICFATAAALTHTWWHNGWGDVLRALTGAAVLFACYLAIHLIRPDGMGLGDVKLAAALGLYLGWHSWGVLAVGGVAGFAVGTVVGVVIMIARGTGRKTGIPYGPSMMAGALIGILAGDPVVRIYLQTFGLA